jgi:hypothetical protein
MRNRKIDRHGKNVSGSGRSKVRCTKMKEEN